MSGLAPDASGLAGLGFRPVRRRPLVAALAVVFAAIVAGCSNYTSSSDVARVDDTTLTIDELRDLMPAFTDPNAGGINSVGNGAASRQAIQYWLSGEIVQSSLDRAATELPGSAIDEMRSQLAAAPAFAELPEAAQEIVIRNEARIAFFNQLPSPNESFVAASDDVDIYVSPRFGTFEGPQIIDGQIVFPGVVALQ